MVEGERIWRNLFTCLEVKLGYWRKERNNV